MTNKKITKRLMAIGVQRNDAAVFARAYRKIMAAGQEDLFPEIVKPVMPVNVAYKHYPAQMLQATVTMPDPKLCTLAASDIDLQRYMWLRLARELAEHLYLSGVMQVQSRRVPGLGSGVTEFVATVHVVVPQR